MRNYNQKPSGSFDSNAVMFWKIFNTSHDLLATTDIEDYRKLTIPCDTVVNSDRKFEHLLQYNLKKKMFSALLMCCCFYSYALLLWNKARNYIIFKLHSNLIQNHLCAFYTFYEFVGLVAKRPEYAESTKKKREQLI